MSTHIEMPYAGDPTSSGCQSPLLANQRTVLLSTALHLRSKTCMKIKTFSVPYSFQLPKIDFKDTLSNAHHFLSATTFLQILVHGMNAQYIRLTHLLFYAACNALCRVFFGVSSTMSQRKYFKQHAGAFLSWPLVSRPKSSSVGFGQTVLQRVSFSHSDYLKNSMRTSLIMRFHSS